MPAQAGIQYAAAFRLCRTRLRLLGPRLRASRCTHLAATEWLACLIWAS